MNFKKLEQEGVSAMETREGLTIEESTVEESTVEDDILYFREKLMAATQVPVGLISPSSVSIIDSLEERDIRCIYEYFSTKKRLR